MIDSNSRLVFVGGLHRSGTTLLYRCIGNHPQVSIFRKTGVPMDEGQYLQSVYPTANDYGGPGKFGFNQGSFLTEHSPLSNKRNADNLLSQWSQYWDTSKPYLVEKSPPNVIRMRFLQSLFPNACFLIICRHPIATSFAIQKWVKPEIRKWLDRRLDRLIKHWLVCYEQMLQDLPMINNVLLIRYEDFIKSPQNIINKIYCYLGMQEHLLIEEIKNNLNDPYIQAYESLRERSFLGNIYAKYICNLYERKLHKFGYSLEKPKYTLATPPNFLINGD